MKFFKNIPILIILACTFLHVNLRLNKRSGGAYVCQNISGDARGYYAWLPAIFIYQDLNFNFYDKVETKDASCGVINGRAVQEYRHTINGVTIDKYYPGAAFMMLPFFGVAQLATMYTAYPTNGYSLLYFQIMPFAGNFYFVLGMLFFVGILGKLDCNVLQKCLAVLLVTFGSNIIFYVVDAPLYSHVFSFALVSALLYYTFCLLSKPSLKYTAIISFLLGWLFITRPVDICIILVLPFILRRNPSAFLRILCAKPVGFISLLPGLIMPTVLAILYYKATGHFFIYSYGNEGFNFLHPHVQQYLFSYNNGILPYTPILFLPFVLLPVWYSKLYRHLLLGIALTLAISIYVNSSWRCWWYGTSFGCRSILDFLPLLGILIALSLKQVNTRRYLYLLPLYLICCALTMLLYHQNSSCHYMGNYPVTDYWQAIDNGLGINK
jgi:hypothetical protein